MFLLSTTDLTEAHQSRIKTVLDTRRAVPSLADRYEGISAPDTLAALETVPVMNKDDLQVALAHQRPRAERGATWVFQSGGSTGAPQLGYAPTGLYMAEVYE